MFMPALEHTTMMSKYLPIKVCFAVERVDLSRGSAFSVFPERSLFVDFDKNGRSAGFV
jgi:hypothetical protein